MTGASATPEPPTSPFPPASPPAPSAPAAPAKPENLGQRATATDEQRLSGKHWKKTADEKWQNSTSIEDLEDDFKAKVKKFVSALEANGIKVHPTSTLRPKQRAYLMHFSNEIRWKRKKPAEVPAEQGVDIVWDHGDEEKSIKAATELAESFGLGKHAARTSRHTEAKAIDMKLEFTGDKAASGYHEVTYSVDGKHVTRTILVDSSEAIHGEKVINKRISNI